jgi:hypothetical protein
MIDYAPNENRFYFKTASSIIYEIRNETNKAHIENDENTTQDLNYEGEVHFYLLNNQFYIDYNHSNDSKQLLIMQLCYIFEKNNETSFSSNSHCQIDKTDLLVMIRKTKLSSTNNNNNNNAFFTPQIVKLLNEKLCLTNKENQKVALKETDLIYSDHNTSHINCLHSNTNNNKNKSSILIVDLNLNIASSTSKTTTTTKIENSNVDLDFHDETRIINPEYENEELLFEGLKDIEIYENNSNTKRIRNSSEININESINEEINFELNEKDKEDEKQLNTNDKVKILDKIKEKRLDFILNEKEIVLDDETSGNIEDDDHNNSNNNDDLNTRDEQEEKYKKSSLTLYKKQNKTDLLLLNDENNLLQISTTTIINKSSSSSSFTVSSTTTTTTTTTTNKKAQCENIGNCPLKYCKYGHKTDSNGCFICDCLKKTNHFKKSHNLIKYKEHSPVHLLNDTNKAKTGNDSNSKDECEENDLKLNCHPCFYGSYTNELGCNTCECKPRPKPKSIYECPRLECSSCDYGSLKVNKLNKFLMLLIFIITFIIFYIIKRMNGVVKHAFA